MTATLEKVVAEKVTVEKVLKDIQDLPQEDQNRLRSLLNYWLSPQPPQTTPEQQQRLAERLLADGLLDHIPQDAHTEAARNRHEPVNVKGRPISETLLEDRE